ncbi:group II truncated hemoglobin [Acetobacter peroxydans]|jgi:hemoglobin|uniref:Globin n=1 Tax=Acetobacter peroxydans TaxID=104098 RepID=A0A4Y3TV26_9PROT|nr:group II truncated hemoglobin [Acetobacter peroxydans]NHO16737.1 globin [Acetobacter peroxydans]GBR36429.1 globin [Acetobacter peroxydans NBRC 13755]GBR39321.1 globin [Acetobacter peroxydans]GEB85359.1 globin [Acetobacter peroxydans]
MTLYDAIGGEPVVRELTKRFYALMDALPEAKACRDIHPQDMTRSQEKLFEYLSGWLGGPPLFTDKYGHPMLRYRHLPAKIGTEEAAGWLLCFRQALDEVVEDKAVADMIWPKVEALGQHMINV